MNPADNPNLNFAKQSTTGLIFTQTDTAIITSVNIIKKVDLECLNVHHVDDNGDQKALTTMQNGLASEDVAVHIIEVDTCTILFIRKTRRKRS